MWMVLFASLVRDTRDASMAGAQVPDESRIEINDVKVTDAAGTNFWETVDGALRANAPAEFVRAGGKRALLD